MRSHSDLICLLENKGAPSTETNHTVIATSGAFTLAGESLLYQPSKINETAPE